MKLKKSLKLLLTLAICACLIIPATTTPKVKVPPTISIKGNPVVTIDLF